MRAPLIAFLSLLSAAPITIAADAPSPDADGFIPMFNGKDFTGWVPVNVAPRTFTMVDGVIHSTGFPTGVMRTERQYENFIIELDWMHEKPKGNAGLFLWGAPMTAPGTPFAKGIEIQILDDAYVTGKAREDHRYTGHGDIFSIHGATMKPDRPHPQGWARCLPSEERCNPAGQWNHYRVEAKDGVVKLSVNGKEVSGGTECKPRKGYLCLESEGSPAQFKNIRIKELPGSNPTGDDVQPEALPFKSIYTGVDLAGWRQDDGHKGHWTAKDWTLDYDGKSAAADKSLWTEKEYGDFEMIVDWRLSGKPGTGGGSGILLRGAPGGADGVVVVIAGGTPGLDAAAAASGSVLRDKADPVFVAGDDLARKPGEWNRFVITVRGSRVTVGLNGKSVVENVEVPGMRERGAIGLRDMGSPMQFASLFVRELKD